MGRTRRRWCRRELRLGLRLGLWCLNNEGCVDRAVVAFPARGTVAVVLRGPRRHTAAVGAARVGEVEARGDVTVLAMDVGVAHALALGALTIRAAVDLGARILLRNAVHSTRRQSTTHTLLSEHKRSTVIVRHSTVAVAGSSGPADCQRSARPRHGRSGLLWRTRILCQVPMWRDRLWRAVCGGGCRARYW